MATTYRTPGVYTEEISVFPPSIAEVESAIPAFVGYTEKAKRTTANDLKDKPTRIKSLPEYEYLFGIGPKSSIDEIVLDDANNFVSAKIVTKYCMYDSIRLFFDNGGGPCYIIAVGDYSSDVDGAKLADGVLKLKKFDEPTILLFPDAATLPEDALAKVQQTALKQCGDLGDRVAVLDTRLEDRVGESFRNKLGINNLKYGAAYAPWLRVNYSKNVGYAQVKDKLKIGSATVTLSSLTTNTDLQQLVTDADTAIDPTAANTAKTAAKSAADTAKTAADTAKTAVTTAKTTMDTKKTEADAAKAAADAAPGDAAKAAASQAAKTAFDTAKTASDTANTAFDTAKTAFDTAKTAFDTAQTAYNTALTSAATAQTTADTAAARLQVVTALAASDGVAFAEKNLLEKFGVYANIIKGINNTPTICPPSGAIAGVYAAVDNTRGVWKAPANVSLNSVIEPSENYDLDDTNGLNVDTTAGKSINAILAFFGKGTLVWGARTLAGNDNEWRYISVRRFFNMVEESVKKSTYWAVFEPNDANTWVKVRGMIENYLTQKWREGALAGSSTKDAFFVRCGLGITMNAQDILEGRMNVEIGMAVVRPAEFIILKFSHKLQTS